MGPRINCRGKDSEVSQCDSNWNHLVELVSLSRRAGAANLNVATGEGRDTRARRYTRHPLSIAELNRQATPAPLTSDLGGSLFPRLFERATVGKQLTNQSSVSIATNYPKTLAYSN